MNIKRVPPRGWSEFVRFRRPDGSKSMAQAMNSDLAGGGQLIVGADRAVIRQMHRTMLKLFGVAFGLLLLLSVAATIIFGRVIQRRLKAIEASAVGIMAGDLSRRMPLDGSGGEFDRLSLILNRMLDRVQDLLDNLRQVSGDIAHDLRTPLQRVRNRLEGTARAAAGTPYQEPLEAAMQETDDLLELFASLLAISEVEGQSVRAGFVPLQLDDVVRDIVEVYQPTFEDADRTLMLFPTPLRVRGDSRLLQRVIANLLDNALLHTPPGSHVQISLAAEQDRAIILVCDDGPGIPVAEHERMFRRLTRLDASRSTPGHGLGLSMVQAIVEAHDGTVSIVPSAATGLTLRIVLPAVHP